MLRWFHSNIANGLIEGINSLVQAAKAKARGYRSNRNLIAMVYLLAGKLDLGLPCISPFPATPNSEEPDFLGHRDIRNTVRYTKLSPPSAGERSGVVTISGPRRTGS